MKITFVYHSCFAVETGSCILVFDYWKDPAGVIPSVPVIVGIEGP